MFSHGLSDRQAGLELGWFLQGLTIDEIDPDEQILIRAVAGVNELPSLRWETATIKDTPH